MIPIRCLFKQPSVHISALGWLSAPRVHYAYEGFASYTVMCRTLAGDQRQAAGRSRDCGPHSAGNPSTEGQGVRKALPDTYHPTLSDWKRGRPPRRYASHGVESGVQLGEYSCRASARPRSCPPRRPSCSRTLGHPRRGHRHANSETAGHPAECHPRRRCDLHKRRLAVQSRNPIDPPVRSTPRPSRLSGAREGEPRLGRTHNP